MARDAGTKKDKPSDQEGKGTPAKAELETQQAAQEAAESKAAEKQEAPKPKPRRKPAAKKAEGTAAEATGVEKEAAEAAVSEGTTEAPAAPKPRRRSTKTAEKKPATKTAEKKPAAKTAEKKPAAKTDEQPAEKATRAPAARTRRRDRRDAGERVTVRAHAKYVRTSARKARLIADHVRGKSVDDARAILAFSPRSVAEDWRKLLDSAVANAEHNHELVGDDLRILNATADEGPTLKRFRPRAQGRATRIRKRTSHLTITLTPKEH